MAEQARSRPPARRLQAAAASTSTSYIVLQVGLRRLCVVFIGSLLPICSLLIRSAWILLYRPFYNLQPANLPGARDVCERSANEIHAIATLFRATFGSLCQSYIFIYSVYWAAHVFMAIAAREGRREDLVGKLSFLREVLAEWAQQPIHQAAIAPLIQQVDNFLGWSPATALQALGPTHLTFDPFEGLFFTNNIL